MSNNAEQLEHLRHTTAHLLAAAVLELYPDAKPTIGPPIERGFYYDFDFGDTKIGDDDLKKIEKRMRKILPTWKEMTGQEATREEAQKLYEASDGKSANEYKLKLIEELYEGGETMTLYTAGTFADLCRGGHIENPAESIDPKAFALLSVAGAYWRGDENNPMLTRIYGTAFETQEELEAELARLEEAKERDHKRIGPALDLFTFSELVGPGLPLFTPRGTRVRNLLDDLVWHLRREKGYEQVDIPHITKKALYETSGHWDKFADELFRITTREGHEFALKPMNCPHHTQIFKRKQWSYRDMPKRYANTTKVYRDEQTGELAGLSRVRAITQDDAHVFCRESQVKEEFLKIWDIVDAFYVACGFPELKVAVSGHDPKNADAYLGDQAAWEKTEQALMEIAKERGVDAPLQPGEAAFYGPKIDFIAKDSLDREWQVATIQLDMNLPERFDLFCIDENGEKEQIVMIHAAIMGAIERFLSVLIEHTAGDFPVWMTPVQVALIPVSDKHEEKAADIAQKLSSAGVRVEISRATESLGKRIREAELMKIPYMAVVGDKEAEGEISIRQRGVEEQRTVTIADLGDEIAGQKPY